ncbi:MAG: hypothetical protein GX089_12105 [Fibrobacter sp.]|nr:hypothetical protein [Fibrobacter sp.]
MKNDGESRIIRLPGKVYQLKCRVYHGNEFTFINHNGNNRYIFRENDGEINTGLLWMGDVDRDGRLDLVVDSYLHYEGYVMRLLLSGSAEPGELFKWVVETYSLSHIWQRKVNIFHSRPTVYTELLFLEKPVFLPCFSFCQFPCPGDLN